MITSRPARRAAAAGTILAMGVLSAGCVGSTGSGPADSLEDMEPVVLQVALPLPENSTPGLGVQAMADYVREESGGKLDFEFYFNGTLIPPNEMLPGLSSGLTDIGLVANSWAPDTLPAGSWTDQLAPSVEGGWRIPQLAISTVVQTRFTVGNEVVRDELASQNIVHLWASATGPFIMLCVDPFKLQILQDLKDASEESMGSDPGLLLHYEGETHRQLRDIFKAASSSARFTALRADVEAIAEDEPDAMERTRCNRQGKG